MATLTTKVPILAMTGAVDSNGTAIVDGNGNMIVVMMVTGFRNVVIQVPDHNPPKWRFLA